MKKTYTLVIIAAVLAALLPTLVIADEHLIAEDQDDLLEVLDESTSADSTTTDYEENTPICTQKYLTFRGKWGKGNDSEVDGYFGGRISRKGRVAVLKGVYNLSDENKFHRIVGIMKKGYFNGMIINNETSHSITGLYRVDKENKLLKMQWMVPGAGGWAVARLNGANM